MWWTERTTHTISSLPFNADQAVWKLYHPVKELNVILGQRIPAGLPRILVSASEGADLIKFAAKVAKGQNAAILSLYVHPRPEAGINYLKPGDREPFSLPENAAAHAVFQLTRTICADAGVPVLQIYAIHNDVGEMMLDHAATWGVEAVVMGTVRNPVQPPGQREIALQKVYAQLPTTIPLIIHGG